MLGIQWLKTLGPIAIDYTTLSMQFQWNGNHVVIEGINDSTLEAITSSQLKLMQATNAIAEFYHLQLTTTTSSQDDFSTIHLVVLPLLQL